MASAKIVELTEDNICKICNNALGKYSCPRCNVVYCSLACYQSVNHMDCSEAFYKESVLENLDKNDKESQVKMMEILQRIHEHNKLDVSANESDDDDEDCISSTDSDDDPTSHLYETLADRLANIDLDDSEDIWANLDDEERKEFEKFLASGDASQYITMWEPWWTYRCGKRCVEISELEQQKAMCPKICDEIKAFTDISKATPAPCVEYNMMNVLAAYVFALRYLNGDHFQFAKETCSYIYNLSLNLRTNQNFDSFNQAICSITSECTNGVLDLTVDQENIDHVKADVQMIVSGPHATEKKYYLYCALSDMLALMKEAAKPASAENQGEFFRKFTANEIKPENLITPDELKKITKKIEYYLSFARDCYDY